MHYTVSNSLRLKYIIFFSSLFIKIFEISSISFHVDLSIKLSIVNTVSINNNVLIQVGKAIESTDVWNWWLIYRPVVKWWVLNWVSSLSQFHFFWFHLSDVQMVWSHFNFKTEISFSFSVSSYYWIYKYWNTLGKCLWLGFFF